MSQLARVLPFVIVASWSQVGHAQAVTCGNGVVNAGEQCDDANATGGDGCTSCLTDPGFVCRGAPSVCAVSCGDGVAAPSEGCDDGNTLSGDGCSASCVVESGWSCTSPRTTLYVQRHGLADCRTFVPPTWIAPGVLTAADTVPGFSAGLWRARYVGGIVAYEPGALFSAGYLAMQHSGVGQGICLNGGAESPLHCEPGDRSSAATQLASVLSNPRQERYDFSTNGDPVRVGLVDDDCGNNSNDVVTYRFDTLSSCAPADACDASYETPSSAAYLSGTDFLGRSASTLIDGVSFIPTPHRPGALYAGAGGADTAAPRVGAVIRFTWSSARTLSDLYLWQNYNPDSEGLTQFGLTFRRADGSAIGAEQLFTTDDCECQRVPGERFTFAPVSGVRTVDLRIIASENASYAHLVEALFASRPDCNDGDACTTDGCSAGLCAHTPVAGGAAGECGGDLVCSGGVTNVCILPAPTVVAPAEGSLTADTTPTISGACVAGASVTVREGASTLCTATCTAGGTYTCSPSTPLSYGGHTVTATQTLGATPSLTSAERRFSVLGPPSITTPTEGAVTGATPPLGGECTPSATVTVREGATTLCTATCTAGGMYVCTPSTALAVGPHAITATQTVGTTTSVASPTRGFVVAACMDTSAAGTDAGCSPALPHCVGVGAAAACVACLSDVHCSDGNVCTLDACGPGGSCTFTARGAGDAGGCAAGFVCSGAPSNMCVVPPPSIVTPAEGSRTTDTTPEITGACVPGAEVTLREDATTLCTATCSVGGTYACSPSTPLALGAHTITATQTLGGTPSTSSPARRFSVVACIDTAAAVAVDDGCATSAPLCVGSGTPTARCQPCEDSSTAGTDLGCAAAEPACVTGTSGANVCVACEDTAPDALRDHGCEATEPMCVSGAGGAPICVACVTDAHCATGRVCNELSACVPGCADDTDCAATPATPVCDVTARLCAECSATTHCTGTELCVLGACAQPDTDGDGVPDELDLDDDDDGIPDTAELPAGLSLDGDGDGILDFEDPSAQPAGFDCAPDAAGVCTVLHPSVDFDGDGIANHLDLDADGDGLLDVVEAGGVPADDGTLADDEDLNGNGLSDAVEATPLPVPNTDGTDGRDFLDVDADGDGLFDHVEGGGTSPPDADGRAIGVDANGDGVVDTLVDVGRLPTPDFDGDGLPDYRDVDDDGDGVHTRFEAPDPNGNGRPDDARDTDGDGVPDYLDTDDDGDGLATIDEMADPNGDGNPDDAVDTNGNGVPDYLDPLERFDGGGVDSGRADGGPVDAGRTEAGLADAGLADAGELGELGGFAGGACGCRVGASPNRAGVLALFGLLVGWLVRRRTRR